LEGANALAKQVLSQLSYTPTVGVTFILKHLPPFRIPILRNIVRTVPVPDTVPKWPFHLICLPFQLFQGFSLHLQCHV
jgi:hypothetical protein